MPKAEADDSCPCFTSQKIMEFCTKLDSGVLEIDSKRFGPSIGFSRDSSDHTFIELICNDYENQRHPK